MNRRGFFKALGAAGLIAAATPAAFVDAVSRPLPSSLTFKRRSEMFDYNQKIGLGVQLDIGDERYRHAILVPMEDWTNLSATQRERTWKLVERKVYEFAIKKRNAGG